MATLVWKSEKLGFELHLSDSKTHALSRDLCSMAQICGGVGEMTG